MPDSAPPPILDNETGSTVDEKSSKPALTVVAIGASAGGLAALRTFFSKVPADHGLAFVVVVHLAPEHESHLAELLQPHVSFPVEQVRETVELEANRTYVIPPGRNLSAIDTHLRLSDLEERRRERAPIDHFFRTLARTHDGHSVAVILTGTGSDGTLGLRDVKEKGGLTVVQDPSEAEYDGMPQSAIASGMVDLVLPLEKIPEAVLKFARTEPRLVVPTDEQDIAAEERQLLQKVFAQLRARTGRDFGRYKRSTILRRIARRMQLLHMEELSHYVEILREQPDEVRSLADDLLITVTSFFRDEEVFQTLEKEIVPKMFAARSADNEVRAWSVGCATGEEAYSLAILLLEEAARHDPPPKVQVFASDLHEHSLERAREGFYPGDIEGDVSVERLARFFHREDGGYRVRREVREVVVFAPHNFLGDPPFSRLDLISCRNVLIYLQRDIQAEVIDLFHYALRQDGVLLLGTSETVETAELFHLEHKKACIYRKRNVPAPEPRLPVFPLTLHRLPRQRSAGTTTGDPVAYGSLHQRMVERYAPPSLLVSPDDKVVHLSEHVGRYLVHPGGEVTANISKLVREELRIELRTLLHTARETQRPMQSKPMPVRFDSQPRDVVMHLRPALEPEQEGYILIIFDEREPGEWGSAAPGADPTSSTGDVNGVASPLHDARAELDLTRQRLQAIIEEYETSQEEMKASNEELQSTNEELRSTMEELETSKEELQSMNEELQTVNQENRHKVEELAQLSSDLQNLMASTDIATLFLDRDLRIMRFTPKVGDLFNIRLADRGRPVSDITHHLGYAVLLDDARTVLKTLAPLEREVQDDAGRWYLTRILPYRSAEDHIKGVVMTFVEITRRKNAEESLRESEERYRTLFESIDAGFCIVEVLFDEKGDAVDYRFLETNPAFDRQTGLKDAVGRRMRELESRHERAWFELYGRVAMTGQWERFEKRAEHLGDRWYDVYAYRIGRPEERKVAILFNDITSRKKAEEGLVSAKEEAERASEAKSQFLAMLSHELRTPLAPVLLSASLLEANPDLPAEFREDAAMIRQNVELESHLISDLLDLTRITTGKLELDSQWVDMHTVVRAAVAICNEETSATILLELGAEHYVVEGDPTRLQQVVWNLVNNAIKFTDRDGSITLRTTDRDGQFHVEVIDTGVGIDPAVLPKLFTAFEQGDARAVRQQGLAISRRIVEAHGGTIRAHSAGRGSGATFTMVLPEAVEPEASLASDTMTDGPEPGQPQHILVVEDHEPTLHILTKVLRRSGHRVTSSNSLASAVAAAQEATFDLIISDLGLPDGNGVDLLRQLGGAFAGPAIALSGYGTEADIESTRAAGFAIHLTKPVDLKALQAAVDRMTTKGPELPQTSAPSHAAGSA